MNSTYIWILLPLSVAIILLLIMRWRTLAAIIAAATALILGVLAAWLPGQEQLVFWQWVIPYADTLNFFGRQLELSTGDRPTLIVLYLTAAMWFAAVPLARPTRLFVPFGMAIVAILTAAIAVEPFLFAAVFIEIAVLLSIPILAPPGMAASRGVLRYLTFLTLGIPFVLISGYLFTGFEAGPGDTVFVAIAISMITIGFALLLAVFPFHTWVPMLAEEAHPYPAAFIFFLMPAASLLLGLGFLDSYAWMQENSNTVFLLQVTGAMMIVTSGVWAAVERNLFRLVGFAVILDIGFSLLAISLAIGSDQITFRILFFAGLLVRGLSLGVLALAMSALVGRIERFQFGDLRGLVKAYPVISISLAVGLFCLAGLPLLASFPFKLGLIEGLSIADPAVSIWVILGSFALITGITRLLIGMVSNGVENPQNPRESLWLVALLGIGIGLLFLIGLYPNLILQLVTRFPEAFSGLG